jgi:predicted transcriptional regulator
VELRDKEAHRLVAYTALDDITNRSRLRYQWTHPHTARLMGVSQEFTSMVANYLEYRRNLRRIGSERGIRPYNSSGAQLFLYDENRTLLDLLNLGTSGDRTEQMAKLLTEATSRKVRIEPEAVKSIENMLGRACGMAWETITATFQRQLAAQNYAVTFNTTSIIPAEVKAA